MFFERTLLADAQKNISLGKDWTRDLRDLKKTYTVLIQLSYLATINTYSLYIYMDIYEH